MARGPSLAAPVKRTTRHRFAALLALPLAAMAAVPSPTPKFQSPYLAIGLSPARPAFTWFSVDSLGQGKLAQNPVLAAAAAAPVPGIELKDRSTYSLKGKPVWRVTFEDRGFTLRSAYVAGAEAPPFTLTFNQRANHATLLGLMPPGERRMSLPCVLHLPDMGTVRITSRTPGLTLDYDARRWKKMPAVLAVHPSHANEVPAQFTPPYVHVACPAATAAMGSVEYQFEVVSIHPQLPGIERDARYDGFRRDWLNIFQVHARLQMLANNASSDPCSFTLFKYADLAVHTPPLAEGLTALDLVRMTLDRYLAGATGYGQIGYGCGESDADVCPWPTPHTSLDTLPSLLLSSCHYIEGARDLKWGHANYEKLAAWGREMFAADKDGNGLVEYPGSGNYGDRPKRLRRPSNWWDTINFGHEDALANALVYGAAVRFADLARKFQHSEDAAFFADRAAKLRAAYVPALLNPATGVIAGWKSADGQLHDYWFTFVQGVAITYGLLDAPLANAVMDRVLAKMKEVGYTRFELGLPGNLIPVRKGDYVHENSPPHITGEPKLDDGSDGFQYYENGGATGCWSYFSIKALFNLGRRDDARRILHPMLDAYARGEFQGFDPSGGRSRDWRTWDGKGTGYEGLLVDNYHALLAVLDDVKASQ
jgi:hypothetical protein